MPAHIPNNGNNSAISQAMAQAEQRKENNVNQQTQPQGNFQQPNAGGTSFQRQAWSLDSDLQEDILTPATTSDVLASFKTAMDGMQQSRAAKTILLGLDNNVETNWFYSSVIMVVPDEKAKRVAFLPIVIQDTEAEAITGKAVRVGNTDRTVTALPMPSDVMVEAYVERMRELVAGAVGDGVQIDYVPGVLLPKGFPVTETIAVQRLLSRVSKSCRDYLYDNRQSPRALNLESLEGGGLLTIRATNGREDPVDTVGLRVRQDFELVLSAQRQVESTQGMSQIEQAFQLHGATQKEKRFSRIGAYIDQRMLPPQVNLVPGTDPRQATRRFVPEIVITGVDLIQTSVTAALGITLSMIAAAVDPRVYRGLIYQRHQACANLYKDNAFNPGNVGMLNLYAGYGAQPGQPFAPYDLQSSTVNATEFLNYLDHICEPTIAVSIDIPRLGSQAAYLSTLGDAARGDRAALDFLKASLDGYTNNGFSRNLFGAGNEHQPLQAEHVFSERLNTIYNGYFHANVGGEHRELDIRHIDTTAVIANFGTRDKSIVDRYVQSFMTQHIDPIVRMANRREVYDAYTNGGFVLNGVSERNTFTVPFLMALAQCNMANGFKPALSFNDPLAAADTGLVAPDFMKTGLWNSGVANAFNAYQGQTAGGGGAFYNPTVSRF